MTPGRVAGILLAAGIALGGGPTRAADDLDFRIVPAEGAAVLVREDRAGARAAALDDALRRAVASEVETLASPEALESKSREIGESVEDRYRTYVKSYRILSESTDADKVLVQAEVEVDLADLRRDLQALRALPVVSDTPRVALFLKSGGGGARKALVEALLGAGVEVVGEGGASGGVTVPPLRDPPDPFRWAGAHGADFVVTGAVVQEPIPGIEGSTLRVARAQVDLKALRSPGGATAAEARASATAVALEASDAAPPAMERALDEAGAKLARTLLVEWGKTATATSAVEVTVDGVTGAETLRRVEHLLRDEIRGVRGVSLRRFSRRRFVYEVRLRGGQPTLLKELKKASGEASIRITSPPEAPGITVGVEEP